MLAKAVESGQTTKYETGNMPNWMILENHVNLYLAIEWTISYSLTWNRWKCQNHICIIFQFFNQSCQQLPIQQAISYHQFFWLSGHVWYVAASNWPHLQGGQLICILMTSCQFMNIYILDCARTYVCADWCHVHCMEMDLRWNMQYGAAPLLDHFF